MAMPELTPEQRERALAKALEMRRARAAFVASLKSGEVTMAQALAQAKENPVIGKTRVRQALRALPGWGVARVDALMEIVKIPDSRRLAGLGKSQCESLLRGLREDPLGNA
ncbi:integration host factor, actinobacterial type [Streptomyces sp. CS014]|uniref:integration host factor, actinobacterial type n=1 Tax=Streptomyces sp. CS014 TaxID=2162707 RepID=UPI000D51B753|nr:integration host factor, actinobacterial type [Streptomyces sp. CS014]PVD04444.1 integration host factor [Streptomyces sp. CS014]